MQGKKDRRETALGATHYQIGDVDIATVLLRVFSNCLVSDNEQSVTDKKQVFMQSGSLQKPELETHRKFTTHEERTLSRV